MSTETATDRVAAYLNQVRERGYRNGVGVTTAARLSDTAAEDVPRLLAAVDEALAWHAPETSRGRTVCISCTDYDDHADWPCGEYEAISRALLGTNEMAGHGQQAPEGER